MDEVLRRLTQAGISAASPDNLISKNSMEQAEVALGLRAPRVARSTTQIQNKPVPQAPTATRAPLARAIKEPTSRPETRNEYEIPLVGVIERSEIEHLTAPMLLAIHAELVRDFARSGDPIEPSGVRNGGQLLESALSRPRTAMSGRRKYPTIVMAAAALLHALIQDHPFHNGNKRTGIVALLVFLGVNGYVLTATEDELFDYALTLAAHDTDADSPTSDLETVDAAKWIDRHSRKLSRQQHARTWRDLRSILASYGCTFEKREGNKIFIRRGNHSAHIGARNDGDELDRNSVAYIRKELGLAESDGIDSEVFYYGADAVSGFINKYRKTLTRLAAY